MTLSIHSRGRGLRCSHFHVATKTSKTCAWHVEHLQQAHLWEQKVCKMLCFWPFLLAGAGGRNIAERKLTWCGLSHSSPVAQARGSPSSACLKFSPWLPVPLGAGNSWKSALGWGAYTTSPQEKTEFLRPNLNSFSSPALDFEHHLPWETKFYELAQAPRHWSSQAVYFKTTQPSSGGSSCCK